MNKSIGAGRKPGGVRMQKGIELGQDQKPRCFWGLSTDLYTAYHDKEWGVPAASDNMLFEKLALEGFQAGLSWLTILNKREAFRRVFFDFDIDRVAAMGARDVTRLLKDASIIRHRKKIEAAISNAKVTQEIIAEQGSLKKFLKAFVPNAATRPKRLTLPVLKSITQSESSLAMSKALRARGFKFIGPTTAYAFMQSEGMVNDHIEGCAFRDHGAKKRKRVWGTST